MRSRLLQGLVLALSLLAHVAGAQGLQTGSLAGTLTSSDGVALPEANIVATSPALQGVRSGTSDVNGIYVLAHLPPGDYTLKISKSGLTPIVRTATVPLGGIATVDA